MGIARIRTAATEVQRLTTAYEACTGEPPATLLRQLACAGRELVVAIGDHIVHAEITSHGGHPEPAPTAVST